MAQDDFLRFLLGPSQAVPSATELLAGAIGRGGGGDPITSILAGAVGGRNDSPTAILSGALGRGSDSPTAILSSAILTRPSPAAAARQDAQKMKAEKDAQQGQQGQEGGDLTTRARQRRMSPASLQADDARRQAQGLPPRGQKPASGAIANGGTTRVPPEQLAGLEVTNLGPGQREEFFRRAMALGQHFEAQTGIPAEAYAAIAASESNFGNVRTPELFGIKAEPGRAAVVHNTPEGAAAGGSYRANAGFNTYPSSYAAFEDFGQFFQRNPRYQEALGILQNGGSGEDFVRAINRAGFAEDRTWAERLTVPLMQEAARYRAATAPNQPQMAPTLAGAMAERGGSNPIRTNGINQFEVGIPRNVAEAICGPAAAAWFASFAGREPNVAEALDLAKQVGWAQQQGMAGPQSQVRLLQRMGVNARLENTVNWDRVAQEVQAGRPVIIDTPQHYFQVVGHNPETGQFDFGGSALALRNSGGQRWWRPNEMGRMRMGEARSAIYLAE
jgi:flagellum-specific peptidoglycan hydrolase FlgJ